MKTIKVNRICEGATLPLKSTDGSACFDISCCEDVIVYKGALCKVRTGLSFEIPPGYHVKLYPRSGMASRGITIPNAPAVIDGDFRGEIVVMLFGSFLQDFEVFTAGSRICQCEQLKNIPTAFKEVDALTTTKRGTGGLGSTGK